MAEFLARDMKQNFIKRRQGFFSQKVLTEPPAPYILSIALPEHQRADSSAVEHLLYTQGVTGSNPVPPTRASMD